MSYSDFNLSRVSEQLNLSVTRQDLFGAVPGVAPSPPLQAVLGRYQSLAEAMGTEKARSELMIAPILVDVLFRLDDQISLFSGIDLPAAPELGLNGVCDFLFSRSSQQLFLTRPIIAVVEAKNENLSTGFGQCIAEMVGARIFNEKKQISEPIIFGVVTTGTLWRFLRMEGDRVVIDKHNFEFTQVERILGVLVAILAPTADSASIQAPTAAKGP